jgi:hypothetical protein
MFSNTCRNPPPQNSDTVLAQLAILGVPVPKPRFGASGLRTHNIGNQRAEQFARFFTATPSLAAGGHQIARIALRAKSKLALSMEDAERPTC